jgi:enoyl-CoA hydratase/carnithine racemase
MIQHRIDGHTAFITLDNPPANTWTPEGLRELEALLAQLNQDRNVYAAVLTGQGEKFFSAGADLKSFSGDKVLARHFIARFGSAFEALMNSRFVTIAAINGYAMGGGPRMLPRLRHPHRRRRTRRWDCRSRPWACCPGEPARRTCRGCWAKAGPSG